MPLPQSNDIETVRASDILGHRYRDTVTGYEGVATGCYHYLHGCTRVGLQILDRDGNPANNTFDFPSLVLVEGAPRVQPAAAGDVPG